jgi:hypothetical protein
VWVPCLRITPKFFALTARGTEKRGARVIAVLHKQRAPVLLVQAGVGRRLVVVGVVPLGTHPAGRSRIHWNLRVNGHLLRSGRYKVSLHGVTDGVLTPAAPPGARTLVVSARGRLRVAR